MRAALVASCLLRLALCQIDVEIKIIAPSANTTIDQSNLNQELESQQLPTVQEFQSAQGQEILIEQCPRGTYAEGSTTVCTDCAAGTASPLLGAASRFDCQICSAGSYAVQKSSTCTLCPVTTFSPSAAAPSSASCLACPPNSNSSVGTDAVTKCNCNDRYFLPTNKLQPLDPLASAQFSSWVALAVGVFLVDVPHVSC